PVLDELERVALPPLAGSRASSTCAVGLAGAPDPQQRVREPATGRRARGRAQTATGRIAPGAVGGRSPAVARGVDHEVAVRAADAACLELRGDPLAVLALRAGAVEVRHVGREPPSAPEASLHESPGSSS